MDMHFETTLQQRRDNIWTIEQGMVRCFLILGQEKALLLTQARRRWTCWP